jgi:hypothetical protein
MLGTNEQFEALISQLDSEIGKLERAVLLGDGGGKTVALLEDLWARRRSLRLLILNRRAEAAKPVVDFQRWRDGNGAIYLGTSRPDRRRELRA